MNVCVCEVIQRAVVMETTHSCAVVENKLGKLETDSEFLPHSLNLLRRQTIGGNTRDLL